MNKIKINTDFIKLDQFLKLAEIVNSGGEAKAYIQAGYIYVNDEICMQRGKKIKKGDFVEIIIEEYEDGTAETINFEIF